MFYVKRELPLDFATFVTNYLRENFEWIKLRGKAFLKNFEWI